METDPEPDDAQPPKPETPEEKYRALCMKRAEEAMRNWDKYMLTLSGGALAVSFAFVKDVVSPEKMISINLLFWAWMMWLTSIVATLISFFTSYQGHMKALAQFDAGTIYSERPGGKWDVYTVRLNCLSGMFFMFGVILIGAFARYNLGNAANPVRPSGTIIASNAVVYQTNVITSVTTIVTAQTNK